MLAFSLDNSNVGCVSIDHTSDGEYLDCTRVAFPGALNHGSTAEAVQNLLRCAGGDIQRANLVGHGMEAGIITGTGLPPCADDLQRCMTLFNTNKWLPFISLLRDRVSNLTLWSCDTGAGDDGADFLTLLATRINAPVAAPTGIIFCEGGRITLIPPATWQIARPGMRPPTIPLPAAPLPINIDAISSAFFMQEEGVKEVPLDDLVSAQLEVFGSKADGIRDLTQREAADLLRLVDFLHPLKMRGSIAAIHTCKLTVAYSNMPKPKVLNIYNDRILRDGDQPEAYYYTYAGFTKFLHYLIRTNM
jgi:hypothetical protein